MHREGVDRGLGGRIMDRMGVIPGQGGEDPLLESSGELYTILLIVIVVIYVLY